ncbi:MAG TPA: outer membrane protein assembly factor BamE [Steroidobacteraceae bacterium]|jgi:outer membrane protein assembly factor BamE
MRLLFTRLGALSLLATLAAGCVFRPDIQQGNYLESKTVDQLQVGMTRTQVRYLLGTPMVPNVFDKDRWDYLFYFRHGRHPYTQRQVIVHFKEDKVASFDTVNMGIGPPQATPGDQSPDISKFPRI